MGASLTVGWLPWTLIVLGALSGAFLLLRPERWWWRVLVPTVVVVSVAGAWVLSTAVAKSLIGQTLATSDAVWIGIGLAATGLMIGQMIHSAWWRKGVAVVAALCVLALSGNQINKSYDQFPRLGDLFGPSDSDNAIPSLTSGSATALPTGALDRSWTPTGTAIPTSGGTVNTISLPGTLSGFQPRESYVYLPPAYYADNPQPLPVLILIHGQPGDPAAWVLGDRIKNLMDNYAAQHDGIAPVVVMPDGTGSQTVNPLCTDSNLGNVGTYLTRDVPAAIKSQLRVDPRPERWAVGGFSYGGTCAFQLAAKYPEEFPTFIDVSGEEEPNLGSHEDTVARAFGGDEARFRAINPLDLLSGRQYPHSAGFFIVGSDDTAMMPGIQKLYAAAQAAGMSVHYWEAPGLGHDWGVPFTGLDRVMPWIGQRLGVTAGDDEADGPVPTDSTPGSAVTPTSASPTS